VRLRLLTYNIRYGGVGREQRLAAVIASCSPDLVVFQEATHPAVIEALAAATGMRNWGARPGRSTAFMSRLDMAHHEWHRPAGSRHHFLELAPAGTEFRVFALHLRAIHSNWTERRRVAEVRGLLRGIERYQHGFHVLAGDFNTLAPGEALDATKLPMRLRPLVWLSGGRIRWETIQVMLDGGYVDGFRSLHPDQAGYTFPTWSPHVRLDYFFLPKGFIARLRACGVVADGTLGQPSDHFPLLAEVDVA